MATELGALQWTVTADINDLKEKLDQSSKRVNVFADSLKKAEAGSQVLLGGLTAIGAGAIGFGAASVKAYQESETAVAQLEATIKSTGGAAGITSQEFQTQAGILQQLSGVSDEAVLATQAMLSTFTNLKGNVMKDATKTVLDMATAMNGGTIPAAEEMRQQSIQLGKALNNPKEGLTALTRVGVTFTEKQKDQITALQDSGKMAEAQNIILKELQTEFGGSAEAAGKTFVGGITLAQQNFGDFMEVVGKGIVEKMVPLVNSFNEWFASIGGPVEFMDILKGKAEQLVPILPVLTGMIAVGLVPALYGMAAGVWATLAPLIPFLATGALVGYLLVELKDKFGSWGAMLEYFKGVAETVYNFLQNAFTFAINGVRMAIEWLTPSVQALWGQLKDGLFPALKKLWELVSPVLIPALKFLGIALGVIATALTGVLIVAIQGTVMWLQKIVENTNNGIEGFKRFISYVMDIPNKIKEPLKRAKDLFDKLNPFHRESPSLVDNVKRGLELIGNQYSDLSLQLPDVKLPQLGAVNMDGQTANLKPAGKSEIHVHVGMFAGTQKEITKITEVISAEQGRLLAAQGAM